MLQDIGPLQIEQKYVGRNFIGSDIEIQRGDEGPFIGINFLGFLSSFLILT